MGKRLYVGNLPYDTDEASLREAFSKGGGTVERVHVVLDRETQRPRGFAFVEMATEEQAKAAMAAMDGAVFGARQLRVTEAEERRAGPGGPGGPGGPRPAGGGFGGPRPAGGGFGPRPVGAAGGGGASTVGGGARPTDDGQARGRNFGPDARPKREREQELRRGAPPKRRAGGDGDSEYPVHGRRGNRRFDEDDDE
ncbi:MAG: RNA recognition motif domain-containing protein [Planctomycetota bacterium]